MLTSAVSVLFRQSISRSVFWTRWLGLSLLVSQQVTPSHITQWAEDSARRRRYVSHPAGWHGRNLHRTQRFSLSARKLSNDHRAAVIVALKRPHCRKFRVVTNGSSTAGSCYIEKDKESEVQTFARVHWFSALLSPSGSNDLVPWSGSMIAPPCPVGGTWCDVSY